VTNPDSPQRPADAAAQAKLMLVLLCCVWGTAWPIMKIALEQIPPFGMRAASAGLGAVALYILCRLTGCSLRINTAKAWAHIVAASMLNIVGFSIFTAFAQLATATSRVTILAYTLPIWSVLLLWLFLGERPTLTQTLALGLCAAGLGILVYPLAATGVPVGILFAVGAAISWAAGTVYLQWAHIKADPTVVACWQVIIAFFVIAACMLFFEGRLDLSRAHASGLIATLFVGLVSNGFAYGLWFTIIRRLPAMTASLGVLGSPVIGIAASMLILGERPTATDFVGFALIFAASACVLLTRQAPVEATP